VRRANAAAFQVRSAFRRRIPLTHGSCWRLSRDLEGRHWCFGFAASAQLPTCLHAQALRASPFHLPALTGASKGHMPFVDFCNVHDPRARPSIPQTPPHPRWQATARRTAPPPCGLSAGRISTAQGSQPPEGPSTPTSTSARRSGFTLTCFRPDTPCRSPTPLAAWKPATKSDRSDRGPPFRRTNEPGPRSRSPVDPLGPPLTTARESDAERPHPRCLPPPAQTGEGLRRRPSSFGHPATGPSLTEPFGPAPSRP
jgi:hypothetical protein